jgi:hypothetical protein
MRVPQIRGQDVEPFHPPSCEHHPSAGGVEHARESRAQSRAGARHDGDLAVEAERGERVDRHAAEATDMRAREVEVRENRVVVIGGGVFLIFVVVGIGSLVLSIMTAVDASKYPEWAFERAATSKFVWQILPIILLFVCGVAGGAMGLIWYSSKRAEVARAAQAGPPPGYGYGAPPGWGSQPPPGGWTPPSTPPPPYPPAEPPPGPPQ